MMEIARFFPFSLFLFLLSSLLAVAATRAESRYSLFWSRQAYRMGLALALAIFLGRFLRADRGPADGFFEGVLLSTALLGLIYAMMPLFFKIELEAGFFSGVSFVLGLVAVFKADFSPAARPFEGDLTSHAAFMFLALAAFSLSFIFSLLFLIEDYLLKRKRIDLFFFRLPPLELISRLNFSFLTVGTASLLGGVLAGIYDLRRFDTGSVSLPAPTLALSVLTLALYGAVLFIRIGPLERRRGTAYVSIASYTCLLVTFLAAHAGAGI